MVEPVLGLRQAGYTHNDLPDSSTTLLQLVVHDLKAPLVSLQWHVQMLEAKSRAGTLEPRALANALDLVRAPRSWRIWPARLAPQPKPCRIRLARPHHQVSPRPDPQRPTRSGDRVTDGTVFSLAATSPPLDPLQVIPELGRFIAYTAFAHAIHVAAELGLAGLLADGPRSIDDLATATSTHPPSLARLIGCARPQAGCDQRLADASSAVHRARDVRGRRRRLRVGCGRQVHLPSDRLVLWSGPVWLADGDRGAQISPTFGSPVRYRSRIRLLAGGETVATMEFFQPQALPHDAPSVQAVAAVVAQLGTLVRRIQSEDRLKREAEELRRTCSELEHFAMAASHDLQEPLSALSRVMQGLRRQYQDRFDQEGRDLIDLAIDGATGLQALTRELLTLSRLSKQAPAFESRDLTEVLSRELRNLRGVIAQTGALVTHEPLPVVRVDRHEAGQLLRNLLANAIKYQHPDAQPRVHVRTQLDCSVWRVDVEDNGIGIPAGDSGRIFEAFYRLHTRHKYDGSGLGLAICKKIVERHGGRIWVHSARDQGSIVSFTLPSDLPEQTLTVPIGGKRHERA
jgi:signal transduction histidine kinase